MWNIEAIHSTITNNIAIGVHTAHITHNREKSIINIKSSINNFARGEICFQFQQYPQYSFAIRIE